METTNNQTTITPRLITRLTQRNATQFQIGIQIERADMEARDYLKGRGWHWNGSEWWAATSQPEAILHALVQHGFRVGDMAFRSITREFPTMAFPFASEARYDYGWAATGLFEHVADGVDAYGTVWHYGQFTPAGGQ